MTAQQVRNIRCPDGKKDVKLCDGNNLYLRIQSTQRKTWLYRYKLYGKEKKLVLGVYAENGGMSLSEARQRAMAMRALLDQGKDPAHERKQQKEVIRHHQETKQQQAITLVHIMMEWFEKMRGDKAWTDKHANKLRGWISRDIIPALGERPASEIEPQEILALCRRSEAVGHYDKAHTIKQTLQRVFAYAIGVGLASRNPAAEISTNDALKSKQKVNRPAFTAPDDVAGLLRAVDGFNGAAITKAALFLLSMLICRPGELRLMEWQEIDLKEASWRIPKEKMKLRRPHFVPLPTQAVAILTELQQATGNGRYVFPSMRTNDRAMSDNTLNAALRRLGIDTRTEHCAHGFRSTGRTLLAEMGWQPDVIERQLAHKEPNSTIAAYDRAQYLPERRKMLQAWADYLDGLRTGCKIIPINRKTA